MSVPGHLGRSRFFHREDGRTGGPGGENFGFALPPVSCRPVQLRSSSHCRRFFSAVAPRDCKAERSGTTRARAKREPDRPQPHLGESRSRSKQKTVVRKLGEAERPLRFWSRQSPGAPREARRKQNPNGRAPIAPQSTQPRGIERGTEENKKSAVARAGMLGKPGKREDSWSRQPKREHQRATKRKVRRVAHAPRARAQSARANAERCTLAPTELPSIATAASASRLHFGSQPS